MADVKTSLDLNKTAIYHDPDDNGTFTLVNFSAGAGGTEYSEGDVDTTLTGTVVMWEDTGDTIRAASAAKPLPVTVISGGGGGVQYTEADVDATITGTAVLWEDTSDTLRAVSAAKPLPVSQTGTVTVTGALTDAQLRATAVNVAITGHAVPLPAGSNEVGGVNVTKVAGTAVDVNSGNKSAGTQRMVIATDQPNLTTALNVSLASVPSHAVTNAGTFAVQATQSGTWDEVGINDSGNSITVDAPVGTPVNVQLSDGTRTATVRDTGATDSLNVAIVDAAGAQIVSFGGGTEYTEDAVAAADPLGKATILVRKDTPATVTTTDGDNVAQRGTNYGAAYTQIVTSAGAYVDTFGGGTQYTEDVASAADPVGNMMIARRRDTLTASEVSADSDNIAVNTTSKGEIYVKHTDNVTVVGPAAEDAALSGNPVRMGMRASAAVPTAMSADGDIVTPWADLNGSVSTVVRRQLKRIDSTPTIATSGYVTGDQMGAAITFTSAALASGRGGQVLNAFLTSRTPTALNALNLHLFEATLTLASSDNAALDLTDANVEAAKYIGTINFLATDYYDTTSNAFCQGTQKAGPVAIPFLCSGSANLIGVIEVAATPAAQYAGTTDVVIGIEVEQY